MYNNMNDYEIIYMVCDEKDNNYNILYNKYKPLINKISEKYKYIFKKFGYEKEDIMQIGYLVLYKTSYMYNVNNCSMFYTYFKNAYEKALLTELRNNSTNKKEVLNNAFSYDITIPNSNLSYIDLIQDNSYKENEDYNKLIINFKNSMSFELGCVFELFYNGYDYEEISLLLDKNNDEIKNNMKEIKRHALTYRYLFLKKCVLQ